MKNKIILIMFFSLLLVFGKQGIVFAEEVVDDIPVDTTSPVVTSYTLNEAENNVVFNPNNEGSVKIVINTDQSVKFNYIYICDYSDEVCNGTTRMKEFTQLSFNTSVEKLWDGERSPATAGIAPDGIYKIKIKMVNESSIETIVVLSLYTISVDTISPTIALNGESVVSLNIGDTYTEPGATAMDDTDGDITDKVIINGTVDTLTAGTYTITYDVKDLAGNNAEQVVRTVNVVENTSGSDIDEEENISIDVAVDVLKNCEVLDIDNVVHVYTASSKTEYLGICALKAAMDSELISDIKLSNQYPSMGLFITAFNDREADSNSEYWALYKNGGYTDFGISTLPILVGDVVSFKLSDFSGTETGDYVNITIQSLITDDTENEEENPSSGGSGGGNNNTKKEFSVLDALNFLLENKSGVSTHILDWVAIASGARDNSDLKSSMENYLNSNPIDGDIITDYERRAMALMALDINPYTDTEINYIQKILDSFNNDQLGDEDLVNDDIFGLIVLQNAGYDEDDEIVSKIISHLVKTFENDSFDNVDMAGALIMALKEFNNIQDVDDVISKALHYILDNQKNDGSFGNVFSTSWAIQALSLDGSFNEKIKDAIDFLAENQNEDGGVLDDNDDNSKRIWATAYAIPAVLELSWNDILNDFDKPEIENTQNNNSGGSSVLLDKEDVQVTQNEELVEVIQDDLILEKKIEAPIRIYTMDDYLALKNSTIVENVISKDIVPEDNKEEKNIESEEINLLQASVGNTNNKIMGNNTVGVIIVGISIFLLGFVLGRKV